MKPSLRCAAAAAVSLVVLLPAGARASADGCMMVRGAPGGSLAVRADFRADAPIVARVLNGRFVGMDTRIGDPELRWTHVTARLRRGPDSRFVDGRRFSGWALARHLSWVDCDPPAGKAPRQ